MQPDGILAEGHLSPKDLGKLYLAHRDKCVQGSQYKLLGTIGLNLGHDEPNPGHRMSVGDKGPTTVV